VVDPLLQLGACNARVRVGARGAGDPRTNHPGALRRHRDGHSEDTPVIRSTARIGPPGVTASGQLSYITEIGGRLVDGIYPWIATLADPWEVTSLEFLEPDHSVYALRPKSPLEVTWGFYSPNASFCYPGGESALS
jgi:hypothetical protein